MESTHTSPIRCVLILKADRLYAEALRQYTLHVLPAARVLVAWSVESAKTLLTTEPVGLFVTGVGATLESDVLDLLAQQTGRSSSRSRRVLVVTVRREYRVLAALRGLAIDGVFDSATERPGEFVTALRAICKGGRYWSQSVVDHMHRTGSSSTALFRLLTTFEQVVLSVIGDGCDNTVAARTLKLSPATVSTVRRELHRKLGVQHRGELVRVAAQHGFVRFTSAGVVRPGFGIMCAAYQARRAKRVESSQGANPGNRSRQ
ncbi:MAG: response regulator transcription factor [Opitutaceae bacterium]